MSRAMRISRDQRNFSSTRWIRATHSSLQGGARSATIFLDHRVMTSSRWDSARSRPAPHQWAGGAPVAASYRHYEECPHLSTNLFQCPGGQTPSGDGGGSRYVMMTPSFDEVIRILDQEIAIINRRSFSELVSARNSALDRPDLAERDGAQFRSAQSAGHRFCQARP